MVKLWKIVILKRCVTHHEYESYESKMHFNEYYCISWMFLNNIFILAVPNYTNIHLNPNANE